MKELYVSQDEKAEPKKSTCVGSAAGTLDSAAVLRICYKEGAPEVLKITIGSNLKKLERIETSAAFDDVTQNKGKVR